MVDLVKVQSMAFGVVLFCLLVQGTSNTALVRKHILDAQRQVDPLLSF